MLACRMASTPKNPALGVLDGIARYIERGVKPGAIEFFAHGTTITTNALLEMRGARVGMLITKGYRAVQEVQAQARDGNLCDYFFSLPAPIAPSRPAALARRRWARPRSSPGARRQGVRVPGSRLWPRTPT